MFKKELASVERGSETVGYTSLVVYEVFVETRKDKEGNLFLNRNGEPRLFAIRDDDFHKLEEDMAVKKIKDDYFKILHRIDEDLVEKVERDGRRIYYVVEPEKIVTLPKGTSYIPTKNEGIKIPQQVGYALVDETVENGVRVLAVRLFETDDHVKEAEDCLANCSYVHKERE